VTLTELYQVLLIAGVVLLASIAAARVAHRIGLPSLLLFLAVGIFLGEDGIGVAFDDVQLAQALGTAALAVILVEGGLTTHWPDVRRLLLPAATLATVGVGISVVITAAGAHWLLGMDWHLALLLGAIVGSTDAAAVFAVLRALPLPQKVTGLLEAESGFNDAPTIILVLVFSTAAADLPEPGSVMGDLVYQLAVGALLGVSIGRLGAAALRHIALPASGLYPLATVGFGITAFAAAGAVGASGIIAAYLSALVLGNSKLPHRAATRSFAEGAGWLAQIGLFVMLGLLVTPRELPSAVLPALGVGLILLLAARPVAVLACLLPFRVSLREQTFISWAGLRGAVPIVLATFPIVGGVEGARDLLNIVFVLVVVVDGLSSSGALDWSLFFWHCPLLLQLYPYGQQLSPHVSSATPSTLVLMGACGFFSGSMSSTSHGTVSILSQDASGQQSTVVSPARDRHFVPVGQQKLLGRSPPQTSKSGRQVSWRRNRRDEEGMADVVVVDVRSSRRSCRGRLNMADYWSKAVSMVYVYVCMYVCMYVYVTEKRKSSVVVK
jgi:potassium/hydrogen antiporter